MKKLLLILSVILILAFSTACKRVDTELYINSEFSEVTMKNIYGVSRNVAKAIAIDCFATDDISGVSLVLPDKWKEYGSDMQVQKIDGGIGVYAFAEGYDLTSLDYALYYADLFAVIYVNEGECDALLSKYESYFTESKYLGYMDGKVCYLLYNKKIDNEKSPMFTEDEREYWKDFLKITSVIDDYIMLCSTDE